MHDASRAAGASGFNQNRILDHFFYLLELTQIPDKICLGARDIVFHGKLCDLSLIYCPCDYRKIRQANISQLAELFLVLRNCEYLVIAQWKQKIIFALF